MRRVHMPMFHGLLWDSLLSRLPFTTDAAVRNWASRGSMPAVLEVGEGLQQAIHSPVAITRGAVGDLKIADVQVNGNFDKRSGLPL